MKLNPTTMSWNAPTTNIDGTPIDYELEYEVGLHTGEQGGYEPLLTIPGQLREGETYEAPISDLMLEHGENTIAIRSFAKQDPDRISEWSEPVTFRLQPVPSAPLELRVT